MSIKSTNSQVLPPSLPSAAPAAAPALPIAAATVGAAALDTNTPANASTTVGIGSAVSVVASAVASAELETTAETTPAKSNCFVEGWNDFIDYMSTSLPGFLAWACGLLATILKEACASIFSCAKDENTQSAALVPDTSSQKPNDSTDNTSKQTSAAGGTQPPENATPALVAAPQEPAAAPAEQPSQPVQPRAAEVAVPPPAAPATPPKTAAAAPVETPSQPAQPATIVATALAVPQEIQITSQTIGTSLLLTPVKPPALPVTPVKPVSLVLQAPLLAPGVALGALSPVIGTPLKSQPVASAPAPTAPAQTQAATVLPAPVPVAAAAPAKPVQAPQPMVVTAKPAAVPPAVTNAKATETPSQAAASKAPTVVATPVPTRPTHVSTPNKQQLKFWNFEHALTQTEVDGYAKLIGTLFNHHRIEGFGYVSGLFVVKPVQDSVKKILAHVSPFVLLARLFNGQVKFEKAPKVDTVVSRLLAESTDNVRDGLVDFLLRNLEFAYQTEQLNVAQFAKDIGIPEAQIQAVIDSHPKVNVAYKPFESTGFADVVDYTQTNHWYNLLKLVIQHKITDASIKKGLITKIDSLMAPKK